jgi:hypothetical protein
MSKKDDELMWLFNHMETLPNEDVSYMNSVLLDNNGFLQPVPAAYLAALPVMHLKIWAVKNAVYQFVTLEMIDWLKNEIGDYTAIEICAGSGCIGRALGIVSIDRKLQENPLMQLYYTMMGQAPIKYPADVVTMEADYGVMFYKPDCVIGAFVTQYGLEQNQNCNPFGPHEIKIVPQVKKYICFGNKHTHAGKHIFDLPHEELSFPWLFSRAKDQSLNRVWVWNR